MTSREQSYYLLYFYATGRVHTTHLCTVVIFCVAQTDRPRDSNFLDSACVIFSRLQLDFVPLEKSPDDVIK